MINRSQSLMGLFPAFGFALLASLAVAAVVAGSASALSISPASGKFPVKFTASGSMVTITDGGGRTIDCSGGSTGAGNFSNGTSGEASFSFTGCKERFWEYACTSAGQAAGTILTSKVAVKPVYLDTGKTIYGLMLTPQNAQNVMAEFKCAAGLQENKWVGSLIGRVTSPGLNIASENVSLAFETVGNGQTQMYRQIEGVGPIYQLFNGGAETGISTSTKLTFTGNKVTFVP